jgi:hypothetical protein
MPPRGSYGTFGREDERSEVMPLIDTKDNDKNEREVKRLMVQLEAELFLLSILHDGPRLYRTIMREGEKHGLTLYQIRAARDRLGVFSLATYYQEPTFWALPAKYDVTTR